MFNRLLKNSGNASTGCYVDVKPSNTRMLFFL
jgi:hypothetical protein